MSTFNKKYKNFIDIYRLDHKESIKEVAMGKKKKSQ